MIRNFVIRSSVHQEFSALGTLLLRNFVIRNFVIRNFVIRNLLQKGLGAGGVTDASPNHHHHTVQYIPANSWICQTKTTEQLFSSSVFPYSPSYIVQARTQQNSSSRNKKNCFCFAFMLYSSKLQSAYTIQYMNCIAYCVSPTSEVNTTYFCVETG